MWVVKLGGSLCRSPCLADWLDCLAAAQQPLIVVAGGGPFADQVRAVQSYWGFDDAAAHRMALLAMGQMAEMLCALHAGFVTAADSPAIAAAIASGRVPVWLPGRMVLNDPGVTADWTVTSDSLALWLAEKLDAQGLLLVKSAPLPDVSTDVGDLQQVGILDAAFHCYARQSDCRVWVMHRAHSKALDDLLTGKSTPALPIAC